VRFILTLDCFSYVAARSVRRIFRSEGAAMLSCVCWAEERNGIATETQKSTEDSERRDLNGAIVVFRRFGRRGVS